MKELSIEEKAKAYDIALDKIKMLLGTGSSCSREELKYVFPELRESEDEMIKFIKQQLFNIKKTITENYELDAKLTKAIDWLKAKFEQKPADKVEPKFHEGDWVVCCDYEPVQIISVRTNYAYEMSNGDIRPIEMVDGNSNIHLWTIQDAKDGDILCTYECGEPKIVFILKGAPKKHYALSYHCYYNIMYPHFASDSEEGCLAPNDEDVKPATKEQRDLLFQKMKEEGYEWDAEEKKLKKIEQKPVEWNEEDEEMLNGIIVDIEVLKGQDTTKDGRALYQKEIDWFKSLKNRVLPQQKQEWSEEDEKLYNDLSDTYFYNDEDYPEETYKLMLKMVLDWMTKRAKSLRPQSQWKPSDEQMEALDNARHSNPFNVHVLDTLFHDLKIKGGKL